MSKKILTVLAPLAALIALAVVPSMAQALTVQAPSGTTLGAGSSILGTSGTLVTKTHNGGTTEGEIVCTSSEFVGKYTGNEFGANEQGEEGEQAMMEIESDTLNVCSAGGLKADITTNAGEESGGVKDKWQLTIQQPHPNGKIVAHLQPSPHPGKVIQFKAQVQLFGGSVTTCDYSATDLQFESKVGSNKMKATGTNQYRRQAGATPCGEEGTFEGEIALTSGGNEVTVDMT